MMNQCVKSNLYSINDHKVITDSYQTNKIIKLAKDNMKFAVIKKYNLRLEQWHLRRSCINNRKSIH